MSSRSGPERTDTHHLLSREKEVADRGREVEQAAAAEHAHLLAHRAQQPQVVIHGDEREREECARTLDGLVCRQDFKQLCALTRTHGDVRRPIGSGCRRVADVEEVEEGVGGVRVVPAERLQAELAVHEDDRVAGLEEVLGGRRAARPSIGCQDAFAGSWIG